MKPIISVIIPIYKVEKYMDKCIQSVVEQTYKNLEIILVDDGSPDKCPEKCDEWAKRDCRIKVIHKQNGGLSDARNNGIETAQGEYIAFVDSDDWISNDMFEKMWMALENNDADMSVGRYVKVFPNGECEESVPLQNEIEVLTNEEAINLLLEDQVITSHVWRKLYKRKLIKNKLFPIGKYYEDVFVMPELFIQCKKIVCLNEVYYYYRQNNEGILGSNTVKVNRDYCEALEYDCDIIEKYMPKFKKKAEYEKYKKLEIIWWGINRNTKERKTPEGKKFLEYLQKKMAEIPDEFLDSKKKKIKFNVIRKAPFILTLYFRIKTGFDRKR